MIFAILFLTVACNKEKLSLPESESESITQNNSSNEEYCNLYDGLTLDGDMLSFTSNDHVLEVLECLQYYYDQHLDEFEDLYGDLTDEEMEIIEEEIGFDDYLPLREFENTMGLSSLRNKIEEEEEIWLDDEELDETTDPDNHIVVDEVTRTIFNETGQLLVAGELVDANELLNLNDDGHTDSRSNNCKTNKSKHHYTNYTTNRLMKEVVSIISYPWATYIKAKTKSYKKKNKRWKKYRRKLKAQAYGKVWNIDCSNSDLVSSSLECKKRKSLKASLTLSPARTKKNHVKGYHSCNGYVVYSSLSW